MELPHAGCAPLCAPARPPEPASPPRQADPADACAGDDGTAGAVRRADGAALPGGVAPPRATGGHAHPLGLGGECRSQCAGLGRRGRYRRCLGLASGPDGERPGLRLRRVVGACPPEKDTVTWRTLILARVWRSL